ncbi:MAG: PAS domain-containing protein [Candidatus Acidiferrum sp.]
MSSETFGGGDALRFQGLLLEAMSTAVIASTLSGEIVYWNRFAVELYGWEAHEVLGKNIMDVVVPTRELQDAAEIMAAVRAGESWTGEFEVKRKDGSAFLAVVTDSPIIDEGGKLIGIVGTSRGLTKERIEMERSLRERAMELQATNEKLQGLSARLLRLRDDEQRRIARELHDSVGQLIAAIAMNIAKVRTQSHKLDEAGARAVAENQALVEQLGKEVRTISHLLHPPLLDELGLISALRMYVEGFSARSKIKVELTIAAELGRLSDDLEIACFRTAQECLTNIHRHSKSTIAAVSIREGEGRVVLEVRDNGQGIPRERLTELMAPGSVGVGLAGMHERLKELGGKLEIKSDESGTSVTATLPLKRAAATG